MFSCIMQNKNDKLIDGLTFSPTFEEHGDKTITV